ncbi:hypothetical protein PIB30_002566 [Stylosanthes scabra]|uniref:Uncharacterized protein n=1 Tax=Stylosanthes scabra TaxID=79078 RepID=A0ABU6YZT8_9FABA|nr:hypothetical protein [Stylosanthes scabra]
MGVTNSSWHQYAARIVSLPHSYSASSHKTRAAHGSNKIRVSAMNIHIRSENNGSYPIRKAIGSDPHFHRIGSRMCSNNPSFPTKSLILAAQHSPATPSTHCLLSMVNPPLPSPLTPPSSIISGALRPSLTHKSDHLLPPFRVVHRLLCASPPRNVVFCVALLAATLSLRVGFLNRAVTDLLPVKPLFFCGSTVDRSSVSLLAVVLH